jgi:hypothetical protein
MKQIEKLTESDGGRAATSIYWNADWQEYLVKAYCRNDAGKLVRYEPSDGHTDDRADAIGTAVLMRAELDAWVARGVALGTH